MGMVRWVVARVVERDVVYRYVYVVNGGRKMMVFGQTERRVSWYLPAWEGCFKKKGVKYSDEREYRSIITVISTAFDG